jgi:hypothetical protein
MHSSDSLRSGRDSARNATAALRSTVPWTGPGLSISVACPSPIAEFARKYPVATKRARRVILQAADICALESEPAAKSLMAQVWQSAMVTHSRLNGVSH